MGQKCPAPKPDLIPGCSGWRCLLCRMPLGVPSRLVQRGLELAQALLTRPTSQRVAGRGCEREAGYVLLGALCTCLPATSMQAGASAPGPVCCRLSCSLHAGCLWGIGSLAVMCPKLQGDQQLGNGASLASELSRGS